MKKQTGIMHPKNYRGKKTKHGSVNPPVIRASTVAFENYNQIANPPADKVDYGRYGLEPAGTFKQAISDLEGAYDTILTSCGLQAVTLCAFSLLKAGDHILIADGVYEPTQNMGKKLLPDFGVEVSFFDVMKPESIVDLIRENTTAILFEVPSSLTMEFPHIEKIVEIAKDNNITSIIDNTWGASGYLLNPLSLGVDISVSALTKYVVGHSDVMMGAISVANENLFKQISKRVKMFGSAVSPDDIYLALRGLKTLPVRINQHHENAIKVAEFMQNHPLVDEVYCPALPTSVGHKNWKKYCTQTNGLFSFTFKEQYGENYIGKFIDSLEFFQTGYSWGGYESLILVAEPKREVSGWNKNRIVRLHIGLENVDDIIADLKQGLDKI